MPAEQYSLVADIGGTNARFALVADGGDGAPIEPQTLICAEYPTIVDAVETYLAGVTLPRPGQASVSVASPVTGDYLAMTNHSWSFSGAETRAALDLSLFKVINDYTALALALPFLTESQYRQVGGGHAIEGAVKAVLGPGTGLGVSGVAPVGDHWAPIEGEGGHVTYGPVTAREAQIIDAMRENYQHVSAETLVSGPGLARCYEILTRLERGEGERLQPGEVAARAQEGSCELAVEALSIFCAAFGTVAGNLALTLGARGGVYIGGGIVLKILDFFSASEFRARFDRHGRLTPYLEPIPIYVIDTAYPALIGAWVALGDHYASVGVTDRSAT